MATLKSISFKREYVRWELGREFRKWDENGLEVKGGME